jgi:hypothetical protein
MRTPSENETEAYYRSIIGQSGTGMRIGAGTGVRLENTAFDFRREAEFEVE